MGAYLFDLEEIGQSWFTFCLHFGKFHGRRKIVDKTTVDFKDKWFTERADKDVAQLFVTIPVSDTIDQRDAKQIMAL